MKCSFEQSNQQIILGGKASVSTQILSRKLFSAMMIIISISYKGCWKFKFAFTGKKNYILENITKNHNNFSQYQLLYIWQTNKYINKQINK